MRRRTLIWVAAAVALSAMSGFALYAAWFHFTPGTPHADKVGDDPVILVWQQRYSDMEALLTGTLQYDTETRCLVIVDDYDGFTWGIVWKRGTSPATKDGRRGVVVDSFIGHFGGSTVLDGDRIKLGGGGIDVSDVGVAEVACSYDLLWRGTNVEVVGEQR